MVNRLQVLGAFHLGQCWGGFVCSGYVALLDPDHRSRQASQVPPMRTIVTIPAITEARLQIVGESDSRAK
jgi:hypothetical protein